MVTVLIGRRVAGSEVREAAFTIEYTERSDAPASARTLQVDRFWAFRSDGAMAFGVGGLQPTRRTILSPRKRRQTEVADRVGLKTTYDLSSEVGGNGRRRTPQPQCAPNPTSGIRLVGQESVLGFETSVYRHETTDGGDGGTIVHQYWPAPELLCFELRTVSTKRDAKSDVTAVFTKTAVRVTPGEPDPRLFAVPAAFREVRPSEFERALTYDRLAGQLGKVEARATEAVSPGWQAELDRMDARYDALNRRR
jgi:hypothetical protein